ncbi:unnamed protein product [Cochlearia groenlandica]
MESQEKRDVKLLLNLLSKKKELQDIEHMPVITVGQRQLLVNESMSTPGKIITTPTPQIVLGGAIDVICMIGMSAEIPRHNN